MRFREVLGLAERAEFFNNYKDDFNFDVVSSEDCDVRLYIIILDINLNNSFPS